MTPTRNRMPWSPQDIAALGTATDRTIAERIHRTARAVEAKRAEMHIDAFVPPYEWTAARIRKLGTNTDTAIAEVLHITRHAVLTARHKHGIPAYRGKQKSGGRRKPRIHPATPTPPRAK